ncbi:uncharacterized protein LTR77_003199 [Saxophila tyrrhenica]|uniref:C2H2-type domain-containing protein n=1 Tax=Saxophila tyrrhenica TaxID=1690608 RepID=A0AAV9PK94_9PEZI|nr:hypothetical protein LTR77_003199 [Saxophila tyrrhenica]
MSGYYYPPNTSAPEDDEFDFQTYQTHGGQPQQSYQNYTGQAFSPDLQQTQFYQPYQQVYQQPQQFQQQWGYANVQMQPQMQPQPWVTPTVPSNVPFQMQQQQNMTPFPSYSEPANTAGAFSSPEMTPAGPSRVSRASTGYLSPGEPGRGRVSRTTSLHSNASSGRSFSQSDVSRSASPSASEMAKWGHRNDNGTWRCAYPGCTSRSTFSRGCDLRKHYKRHTKSLFCRHDGCPQATEGGFSSKKDRARHEAKHDPQILCEWEGCNRLFSRVDNMKDHVRRVHKKRLER